MPGHGETSDEHAAERFFRILLAVAVAAPLLIFVAAAWYDHEQVMGTARRHVAAAADALAEHAQKIIESSQLGLALMADRVSGLGWSEIAASADVHNFLTRLTEVLPELESAFLVTPDGFNSASSRAFPMRPFDLRDRPYYRAAQAGQKDVFISPPFRGRMAGTTAFTISRPRDPDRPDSGLVALTLSPAYFEQFYQTVAEPGLDSAITLVRSDGAILARYPQDTVTSLPLNANSLFTPALINQFESGVREAVAHRDGLPRIGAFRRLRGFPVTAAYSVSVGAVLVDWYRHIAVIAGFALVLAVVLVSATRGAMRHARQERESLRLLIAETARREQAEEALRQLQKIEALGRLTGGVAHDFNNLLTAVMGSLELAIKRVADPRVTRLLNGAMEAAGRGARITQHLLAFARQQNIRMRPVSITATLRGMEEMLRHTLGAQIIIDFALDDDVWHAVADATQLELVVLNLAINARDAMPKGGVLRLIAGNVAAGVPRPPEAPPGDMVMIAVSDTGEGMDEVVRRRAIEPFFTTKTVGQGTGLGLSMADGFVRQAGGGLALESAPGAGTIVRIFLPRAAAEAEAPSPSSAQVTRDARVDVLLVDDDNDVRELTADMLRELGHHVVEASDGPAAIERLAAHPAIALMVVDYAMPGMNGGQVARRAIELRPDLAMLFVTGYAERTALQEWTARGYPLLPKPFSLTGLSEAIAASLERRAKPVGIRGHAAVV